MKNTQTPSYNILQILPRFHSGGVERGAYDIGIALQENQMGSFILSSEGSYVKPFIQKGGHHFNYPLYTKNPFKILQHIFLIKKICLQYNIHLIHVRSRAPAWSAYFAAKLLQIPLVTTFHGAYGQGNKIKKLYNAIMLKADKVIAVSDYIKNHILENYTVDPLKIVTIYRGIDDNMFHLPLVNLEEKENLRKKFDLPLDKKIILMPARFTKGKGHFILLNALKMLDLQDQKNIFVLLCGSWATKESYRQEIDLFIRQKKIYPFIRIIDHTPNIIPFYQLCDFVCLPGLKPESFGRVIVESLACHKPVIATNIGGAKEILSHYCPEGLIPANNIHALRDKISSWLLAPPSIQSYAALQKHYLRSMMAQQTLALYKQLIERKK